jgi:hypothetical protein
MFPMGYINAIILGNNFSGIFVSVCSILSKVIWGTENLGKAAMYYFIGAFIALLSGLVGYFGMQKTVFNFNQNSKQQKLVSLTFLFFFSKIFFKFYENKLEKLKDSEKKDNNQVKTPYGYILRKIGLLLFCIWLNFFSTLCMFPVVQTNISGSDDFFIKHDLYQDFVTFLTFNILVFIGNLISNVVRVVSRERNFILYERLILKF